MTSRKGAVMKFEINDIEREEFWRHRRTGSRLVRVAGTKRTMIRIRLQSRSRDGQVLGLRVSVRRKTREQAVKAVRELLDLSETTWARMLAIHRRREKNIKARVKAFRAKEQAQRLRQAVREGEKAKKELEKKR